MFRSPSYAKWISTPTELCNLELAKVLIQYMVHWEICKPLIQLCYKGSFGSERQKEI